MAATDRLIEGRQMGELSGSRTAMEDPYHDLVLAMLTLAIAAMLLVAGGLYLMTRPDPPPAATPAAPVVTSSVTERAPGSCTVLTSTGFGCIG